MMPMHMPPPADLEAGPKPDDPQQQHHAHVSTRLTQSFAVCFVASQPHCAEANAPFCHTARCADAGGKWEQEVRRGFVQKVLFIVAIQLLVTTGICLVFFFVDPVNVRTSHGVSDTATAFADARCALTQTAPVPCNAHSQSPPAPFRANRSR